ncbi:hypothetical protein M3231_06760 [Neobacillus mesonae]|nr:hypothetical protein [Neobacillus mesonae]
MIQAQHYNTPFTTLEGCFHVLGIELTRESIANEMTVLPQEIKIIASEYGWDDPEVTERICVWIQSKMNH